MGVSHFLEHMMFKGTAQRTAEDVNREFDAMGASNNAYTSEENTVYWARVLPEKLPLAVDLGDLTPEFASNEGLEVLDSLAVDLGDGHEGAHVLRRHGAERLRHRSESASLRAGRLLP